LIAAANLVEKMVGVMAERMVDVKAGKMVEMWDEPTA
jgi:hypothetical protein